MHQSRISILLLSIFSFVFIFTASAHADRKRATIHIPGYVSHGVNVFNDKAIVDYSAVSPAVPWLSPNPLIKEIGVFDPTPGATDAAIITEYTDGSRPLATIRSFADFFNPNGSYDPSIFNRTLDTIGATPFGFQSLEVPQRVTIVPLDEASPGDIYRSKGNVARPTVEAWNSAGGVISINCKDDGSAKVSVTLKNAFPNSLYTLWDIGVLDPLTDQEQGYVAPFGGLPNALVTDSNGCAHKEMVVAFCPNRSCLENDSCTSYVSAFFHWDAQLYGGSAAATFAGAPAGVIAANHVVWPMSGEPLIDVQNPVAPGRKSCKRD